MAKSFWRGAKPPAFCARPKSSGAVPSTTTALFNVSSRASNASSASPANIPANYHVTFSLADGNDTASIAAIDNGMNVAAVFRDKATVARYMESGFMLGYKRVPVIRGDDTDLRFLDMPGHVIALYAKGNAKKDRTGFVRD
jgi:hypothetical protein